MKEKTLLMAGDVTGETGLAVLEKMLPALKAEYHADLTVVNGENAADGFGMTEASVHRIFAAGADVITSGNHVWEKRDFLSFMEAESRVLRPANYALHICRKDENEVCPEWLKSPGHGFIILEQGGVRWLVINLQGREFMTAIDCPFRAFDAIYAANVPEGAAPLVVVDFHAESGREKEALAFYIDGRATVLAGTHTHIQTADERLLPQGTAYITDLGMTGAEDGIIGMDKEICLERTKTQVLFKLECAQGQAAVQGIVVRIGADGKPASIERFNRRGR